MLLYLINYLTGTILVVCSQPLCSGNVPISRRALQLQFSYSLTPTGRSANKTLTYRNKKFNFVFTRLKIPCKQIS